MPHWFIMKVCLYTLLAQYQHRAWKTFMMSSKDYLGFYSSFNSILPVDMSHKNMHMLETDSEWYEPSHDKTNKMTVRPAKTQISLGTQAFFMRTVKTLIRLGGCPGWSESSLGAHATLLVLSWGGSYVTNKSLITGSKIFFWWTWFVFSV